MWTTADSFIPLVTENWNKNVHGCPMFRVIQRLKWLKTDLKELNKQGYSEMEVTQHQKHQQLLEVQGRLHASPGDPLLATEKKKVVAAYKTAYANYISFLQQSAKMHWLQKGDENSRAFHQSVKQRRKQNKIYSFQSDNGYFTPDDINKVLEDIPSNKAPGLDGYNNHFFKIAWPVIHEDLCAAIMDFFNTGKILKEVNVTSITLVPKVSVPTFADDLLMFCKGDPKVIQLMLEGFDTFSKSTGLTVNPSKSTIYYCGLNDATKATISSLSGFPTGSLPFRYLGVPISPWKLKGSECDIMIDKMVARIKVWSSRNLSFAGRVQLFGNYEDSRPGPVAWDKLCQSKKCGGIGFRNIVLWDQAAICKQGWSIAQKKDNLWDKCSGKLLSSEWLTKSRYSIKEMYSNLCDANPKVHWHKQLWNRLSVPKHRFILWLFVLDRLKIKARLFTVGVCLV
ncbi:uncharacterized protein [Spinacia oleracea]|uniref:Reverse transcriptase zinc-binding domain-containing protein n=1 Tax=Spinacia oleracea TaxID=3562 RepID=A0ABM3QRD1_SPIOL|nr:uncharacterized protein LOC130461748 [Spinacia oleracea]